MSNRALIWFSKKNTRLSVISSTNDFLLLVQGSAKKNFFFLPYNIYPIGLYAQFLRNLHELYPQNQQ